MWGRHHIFIVCRCTTAPEDAVGSSHDYVSAVKLFGPYPDAEPVVVVLYPEVARQRPLADAELLEELVADLIAKQHRHPGAYTRIRSASHTHFRGITTSV